MYPISVEYGLNFNSADRVCYVGGQIEKKSTTDVIKKGRKGSSFMHFKLEFYVFFQNITTSLCFETSIKTSG